MKKAAFLVLCLAGAAMALGAVAGGGQETLTDDLDRHIGRDLVGGGRAEKADVGWLLPQACPPFYLRDSGGAIIDPNDPAVEGQPLPPVSAVQTCMKCKETHDPNRVMGGYHFQTGRDELFPATRWDEQAPVDKGSGYYGKWLPLYQRELAPKSFDDPAEIDMTAYEWVSSCGVCHPGGGPAELDRGGRRYDWVLSQEPVMADYTYDGDYYQSRWDESGVVEADCFICHLENYEYSLRAQQIKKLNYKWATTEAAGLGHVEGAVIDDEVPSVVYNTNLFGADGKVHLHIQRPTDRACMFCHTMSSVQKRGTTWHNPFIEDVHSDIGIACTDCHPGDIRHNFAKGDSVNLATRNDLDNTMQSCEECHYESKGLGAPDYDHPGIPPIHFERMSCESCHVTTRPFLSARVIDTLTGKAIELPASPAIDAPQPAMFGAVWGTIDIAEETSIVPFSAEQIEAAANLRIGSDSTIRQAFATGEGESPLPESSFSVREFMKNDEGPALADTADKRKLMLLALEQTGSPDNGTIIACLFRGQVYRVLKGKLVEVDTTLQPRRVGRVAQYPVTQMYDETAGEGVLSPMGYQLEAFWAFEEEGTIRPLFLREMAAAWQFMKSHQAPLDAEDLGQAAYVYRYFPKDPPNAEPLPIPNAAEVSRKEYVSGLMARVKQYGADGWYPVEIWDDNNDRWPEVNTNQEMRITAWAITQTMERLKTSPLYYIKGESAYRIQHEVPINPYTVAANEIASIPEGEAFFGIFKYVWDGDRWKLKDVRPSVVKCVIDAVDLASAPQLAALAQRLPWNIAHGVEPAGRALGAKCCTDCHSMDSDFFFSAVLVDPFDETGAPVTVPAYEVLGYRECDLQAAAWREQWLRPYAPLLVLVVLVLWLIHYAIIGIRQDNKTYAPDTKRFSFIERMMHLGLMVSVSYLSVTGFCYLLGMHDPLGAWSRVIHTYVGYAAAGFMAVAFLRWFIPMLPRRGDLKWMLHLGGYLTGRGHYPAHKFNAGQKILFWKAVVAMAVLIGTGIYMALNRDHRFPEQQWVYFIHDVAALVMILLFTGHIYLAVFVNPHSVRSLFGGMVSSQWAKEHHPDWKHPEPVHDDDAGH